MKTIDSFHIKEKIALIKIDIEGMESYAIRGARQLIESNRPLIYAEATNKEDFLKLDREMDKMKYVHWDFFGEFRTHFYVPIESVGEKEMLRKTLSNNSLVMIQSIKTDEMEGMVWWIISKIKRSRNVILSAMGILFIIVLCIVLVK